MSFRGEIKDFTEGMKAGQEYWQRSADIDYRRASFEKIRQPTEAEIAAQPGAARGGSGVLSDTPQVSQGGDGGGKVSIKRTGDDEAAARRDAIASIESGGNYRAVGSQTKNGDRAYGRYQIMGNNIPVWTKQVLGKSMTPGEFLGDQQAQDQVFDVMFDGYVGQFGPAGAAQAWLGGPGSVGKTGRADMHGTTVGAYGQRFLTAYNQFGGSGAGSGDAGTQVAGDDHTVSGGGGVEIGGGTPKGRGSFVEEDPNAKPEPPGTEYMAEARASPEQAIEVSEAAPAQVGTPQVQTAFFAAAQPQAGGLSDPRDQEVRPALFAAEGGAIPEPDKYNAARGYTQPIAQTEKASWTARRVGEAPAASAAAAPATGSYQQKFRDAQAASAAAKAAAAQPAAAQGQQGYAQQLADWEQKANNWTGGQTRFSNPYMIPAMQMNAFQKAGAMPAPGEGASSGDQALYMAYQQKYAPKTTTYRGNYGSGGGGSGHEAGGMVRANFAEGGAIPAPGEAFARGGRVKDLRSSAARGRSYSPTIRGGRSDSAGYTTSSPGWRRDEAEDDEPYFKPRSKPLPPSGIQKITKKGKRLGAAAPKDRGPQTTSATEPELRKAAGTPTEGYEPKARAAGTPTEGYEPKARAAGTPFPPQPSTFPARPEVHSDNTYPVRPQQGPPVPPRVVQPGSKGHSEPPPGSAVIDIDPRRFGRSGGGAPPAIDNGMSTIPGVRNAVPGTDVPRGGTWVDANTGQPTAPPAIPDPTAMQGAWVNGMWVPFNTTAAPGQGFARGGKVEKDDKNVRSSAVKGRSYRPTFANSRADSAGYTTSSPGWRRDEEFPEAPRAASPRRGRGGASGGDGGVDPQTTGAIPTPSARPILEDRETRWRGSDYPILEDRATRFRRPDVGGTPTLPYEPKNAPIGSTLNVPEAAPAAVPYVDPYTVDVNTSPMDPGATAVPRYAEGGAVPDDEDQFLSPRAESAGYTTSAAGRPAASRATAPAASTPRPAPAAEDGSQKADVEPTPHLLSTVSEAVKGGARFLTQHFGLSGRGDGAVPTPESGAAREDGIRRFASGEGAMTPDEIQGIDDAVDPNRELSEGDRQMNRFAQTMNWYLSRGRKEEAEAAAAGLMQYGAQRFGKLGSMSGAAYKKYLETKDPKDLEAATQFLSKAYEMIPDGAQMAITIDPDTHMLQATRVGANGEQEAYDISPGEIPGLIQQTMNGSGYWKQIFSLSDPTGAHQEDAQAEARRTADTAHGRSEKEKLREHGWDIEKEGREAELAQKKLEEQRAYTEGTETKTHERDRKEKLADDLSAEARARRQTLLSEALTRTRPDKTGKAAVDPTAVAGMLETADSIKAEIGGLDPVPPELQDKLDEALSRLYDASGQDEDLMTKLGYGKETWRYRGAPPVAGAKKSKDGNWYKPDPARPGKWIKLTPQEAPAAAATG